MDLGAPSIIERDQNSARAHQIGWPCSAKDVPTLKAEISKALTDSGQRFLFVVDAIDRLTPNEVRAIFKVVKALADFPNVIYLLAFDRKTVAEALEVAHQIDGEASLEKIVQAPFSLPAIDRVRLRTRLQLELGRLIDQFKGYEVDRTHWANVYMDGLDPYIQKPRNIVRVLNALTVTYPAVAGEVNTVDFIAMEFLRLFEPAVYGIIRDHREMFTGHSNDPYGIGRRDSGKSFHEAWLNQVRTFTPRELLDVLELSFILYRWMRWGDPNDVIQRVRPLFESDETLPLMLEKLLRFGTRHVSGDVAATRVPLLNPKHFEQLVDIVAVEPRVRSMLGRQDLTENQRIAGEQYIRAMGRIHDGKDPDSMRED